MDRIVYKGRTWEARVEMEIFSLPGLSSYDKLIYVLLRGFANHVGHAFPSTEKIAALASCCERQVRRATANLVKCGLLRKKEQFNDKHEQLCNLYEIYDAQSFIPLPQEGEDKAVPESKEPIKSEEKDRPDCQSACTARTVSPGRADCESAKQLHINNTLPTVKGAEAPADTSQAVSLAEIPVIMRPPAEYLLLKTGRRGLSPEEVNAFKLLEKIHLPARIQQEINTAIGRFQARGRPLGDLTAEYLYESLKHQNSKRQRAKLAAELPPETAAQYSDYEAENMRQIMERYGGVQRE